MFLHWWMRPNGSKMIGTLWKKMWFCFLSCFYMGCKKNNSRSCQRLIMIHPVEELGLSKQLNQLANAMEQVHYSGIRAQVFIHVLFCFSLFSDVVHVCVLNRETAEQLNRRLSSDKYFYRGMNPVRNCQLMRCIVGCYNNTKISSFDQALL